MESLDHLPSRKAYLSFAVQGFDIENGALLLAPADVDAMGSVSELSLGLEKSEG